MDLARLRALLDAYGADPGRWPEAERAAARDLVARSAEARALQAAAADLDGALAASDVGPPSPALAGRILAAAPAPRRRAALVRRSAWGAAALAAGVAVWLARRGPDGGAPGRIPIEELGVYATATDALLDAPEDLDTLTLGCDDSGLGCPDLSDAPRRQSRRGASGSLPA